MAFPTLHDDGRCVTLDLHGASVDEALKLTRRVVQEAARRGRASVKVVHGTSTSRRLYANRTIKHALHDLLDRGGLAPQVTDAWRTEGHLMLSLDVAAAPDPARLFLQDVWP